MVLACFVSGEVEENVLKFSSHSVIDTDVKPKIMISFKKDFGLGTL